MLNCGDNITGVATGFVAMLADPLGKFFCRHLGTNIFACGVDIHHGDMIRLVKGRQEIIKERLGATVTMWLKNCDQPPAPTTTGCAERSLDFHRMMTVVVHHHNFLCFTFDLEPAANAAKVLKTFGDCGKGHVELHGHSNRGQSIKHVMTARHADTQTTEGFSPVMNLETGPVTLILNLARHKIRL